jgi:hypothetical protein
MIELMLQKRFNQFKAQVLDVATVDTENHKETLHRIIIKESKTRPSEYCICKIDYSYRLLMNAGLKL